MVDRCGWSLGRGSTARILLEFVQQIVQTVVGSGSPDKTLWRDADRVLSGVRTEDETQGRVAGVHLHPADIIKYTTWVLGLFHSQLII